MNETGIEIMRLGDGCRGVAQIQQTTGNRVIVTGPRGS